VDPTVNEFEIQTQDADSQFASLLSMARGGSLEVTERHSRFLVSVASELGNFELYFSVQDVMQKQATVSTFWEHFHDCDFADTFAEEAIEFLAVHFLEFEQSFLTGLPVSVLGQIIERPSLHIESEDSLFQFVISQIESTPDYLPLLGLVRFDYLKKTHIDQFVLWSFEHFDDLEMAISLWRAIAKRLSARVDIDAPLSSRYRNLLCPREGSPLDGIIARLTRACGGNVHSRGIVMCLSQFLRPELSCEECC
jgi:hypothetical protein